MIDKKELRSGNFVNVPHGDVQIDYLIKEGVHLVDGCGGTWQSLEPIPLTPEWLERFTFQSEINLLRNHKLFIIDNYISLCHENKTFSVAIHSTLGAYPLAIKLSFVHQLQNLYFALTGSELILKQ